MELTIEDVDTNRGRADKKNGGVKLQPRLEDRFGSRSLAQSLDSIQSLTLERIRRNSIIPVSKESAFYRLRSG